MIIVMIKNNSNINTYLFTNIYNVEPFLNYKKCSNYKSNTLMDKLFVDNNFKKTTGDDWDLYVPCGYTNVETELKTIIPKNSNQKIFGIPGSDRLAAKDNLWYYMKKYYSLLNYSYIYIYIMKRKIR